LLLVGLLSSSAGAGAPSSSSPYSVFTSAAEYPVHSDSGLMPLEAMGNKYAARGPVALMADKRPFQSA